MDMTLAEYPVSLSAQSSEKLLEAIQAAQWHIVSSKPW